MAGEPLMPIGRFARSCRLSVKALRHYDELGLLGPEFVDPGSGYRYYSRDQARQAIMIGMLRSLDLPLPVIKQALAADADSLRELVDRETSRLERELQRKQRAVLSLQHIARSGGLAPYDITMVVEPERSAFSLRGRSNVDRLIPDTTELIYALLADLDLESSAMTEPPLVINEFESDGEKVGLQACVFAGDVQDTARADERRAEPVSLAGGTVARLRHSGPYETLGIAHHALFAWAQERGHQPMGPIWEFYLNDPGDTRCEELLTDVALPLVEG